MQHTESVQVNDLLRVSEDDKAYFVVLENDQDDWLVRFEKAPDFAAREWAENMAESYNDRFLRPESDNHRWTARPPEIPVSRS